MHKLFVTISFTGLCFVTHAALAEPIKPHPPSDIAKYCEAKGGTFGTTGKSYYCETKTTVTECLWKNQKCIQVTKGLGAGGSMGDGGKVASGTTKGLGSTTKLPGASAAPSTGGTFATTKPAHGVGSVAGGAVSPTSPTASTGGILATTRTGQGIGSLTGGTNGRQPR
jgi:hypothetical protein